MKNETATSKLAAGDIVRAQLTDWNGYTVPAFYKITKVNAGGFTFYKRLQSYKENPSSEFEKNARENRSYQIQPDEYESQWGIYIQLGKPGNGCKTVARKF